MGISLNMLLIEIQIITEFTHTDTFFKTFHCYTFDFYGYICSFSELIYELCLGLCYIIFHCLYKSHCPLFFARPYIFPTQLFHSFEWLFYVTVVMLMTNSNGTRSHTYDQFAATFLVYLRYSLH